MKGLKRFAALLACMMILVSCMIPSAFATADAELEANTTETETGGGGETGGGEDVSSINDVQASATGSGKDMKVTITGITDVKKGQTSVWERIFTQYRGVIVGLSGVGAITMIVFFIINFMKLGASSGNPQQRTQALVGIIWCGLAAAGLGGVTIFVGFFYNMLG